MLMISEVKRVRVSNKVSLDKYDKWLNLKKKKKKSLYAHTHLHCSHCHLHHHLYRYTIIIHNQKGSQVNHGYILTQVKLPEVSVESALRPLVNDKAFCPQWGRVL